MSRLTAAARRKIPLSKFALPEEGRDKPGGYPVDTKKRADSAKRFAGRYLKGSKKARVDAKANRALKRFGGNAIDNYLKKK